MLLLLLLLADDGEVDGSLGVLQQSDGFLVSFALEEDLIDRVNLVTGTQEAALGGGASFEDRFDEDGQIALRAAPAADYAEPQAVGPAFQDHLGVGGALGGGGGGHRWGQVAGGGGRGGGGDGGDGGIAHRWKTIFADWWNWWGRVGRGGAPAI